MTFQEVIFTLENFWAKQGCIIEQPFDLEIGAGTFHPTTFFKSLGPEPWKVAYVAPSRRPKDGRYGKNPNRLQRYYQYQIIIKPPFEKIQDIYLESLKALGLNLKKHDIRFVEDNWESPSLGAWGLGWEVWLDGLEITQFTYFQQMGGIDLDPISVELTYGLERLAMYIQKVNNFTEINWQNNITYGELHLEMEKEYSKYNFEIANTSFLFNLFKEYEQEALRLIKEKILSPAYEYSLKCSHTFNLLEARGVISPSERTNYILRIQKLTKSCAILYLEQKKSNNQNVYKSIP